MSPELELLQEELAEEEESMATFEHEHIALKIAGALSVNKLFDYPFDHDPLPDPKPKTKKNQSNV